MYHPKEPIVAPVTSVISVQKSPVSLCGTFGVPHDAPALNARVHMPLADLAYRAALSDYLATFTEDLSVVIRQKSTDEYYINVTNTNYYLNAFPRLQNVMVVNVCNYSEAFRRKVSNPEHSLSFNLRNVTKLLPSDAPHVLSSVYLLMSELLREYADTVAVTRLINRVSPDTSNFILEGDRSSVSSRISDAPVLTKSIITMSRETSHNAADFRRVCAESRKNYDEFYLLLQLFAMLRSLIGQGGLHMSVRGGLGLDRWGSIIHSIFFSMMHGEAMAKLANAEYYPMRGSGNMSKAMVDGLPSEGSIIDDDSFSLNKRLSVYRAVVSQVIGEMLVQVFYNVGDRYSHQIGLSNVPHPGSEEVNKAGETGKFIMHHPLSLMLDAVQQRLVKKYGIVFSSHTTGRSAPLIVNSGYTHGYLVFPVSGRSLSYAGSEELRSRVLSSLMVGGRHESLFL